MSSAALAVIVAAIRTIAVVNTPDNFMIGELNLIRLVITGIYLRQDCQRVLSLSRMQI